MSTTRVIKMIKTEDEIRLELEKINKEFKVNFTLDVKIADKGLIDVVADVNVIQLDKPKKLKHYEPIQQDDKKQVRMKR